MNSIVRIQKGKYDRIKVSFSYNPVFVEKIKRIKGRSWHPEGKYWSFLNSPGTLEEILKVFSNEEVYIDPDLRKKVMFEVFRRELKIRKYNPKTIKDRAIRGNFA